MTCAWWFGCLETSAYGCNSPHPNGAMNMYATERVPIIIRSATTREEGCGQPKCVVLRGARRNREWIRSIAPARDLSAGKASLPVVNAISRVKIGIGWMIRKIAVRVQRAVEQRIGSEGGKK